MWIKRGRQENRDFNDIFAPRCAESHREARVGLMRLVVRCLRLYCRALRISSLRLASVADGLFYEWRTWALMSVREQLEEAGEDARQQALEASFQAEQVSTKRL